MVILDWEQVCSQDYGLEVITFADLLVQNFFLPCKISFETLTVAYTDVWLSSESFYKEDTVAIPHENLRIPKHTLFYRNHELSSYIEKRMSNT